MQEQKGTPTMLVSVAAALFVFLVLAANYESLRSPLAVVPIVPICLLASVFGLLFTPAFYTLVQRTGLRPRPAATPPQAATAASDRLRV